LAAEQLTNGQLTEKLLVLLQEWPLYRQLHYTGADRSRYAPDELRLFCSHEECGFQTKWKLANNVSTVTVRPRGAVSGHIHEDFYLAKYVCRNCGQRVTRYFYFWKKLNDDTGWIYKAGQSPQLDGRLPKALEDALDADDLSAYKNCLRMRNFNFGIAAVAYKGSFGGRHQLRSGGHGENF
jgi:hypothetical protein